MLHSLPHQNADLFCTEGSSAYSSDPLTKLQAVHELASRALAEDLRSRDCLTSPGAVGEYLRHRLAGLPHEVFVCIQLDAQHRVIAIKELFPGTLTQTSVYPREFVMASLRANAAAVIFAHNHPLGRRTAESSRRAPHPHAQGRTGDGGRQGPRSLPRRGNERAFLRGARLALKAC